jgi:hypothetical protein
MRSRKPHRALSGASSHLPRTQNFASGYAAFDDWYKRRHFRTCELVSYADYANYTDNQTFPRRSQLYISNNTLRVVVIEGTRESFSIDLNPTLCRTVQDFLDEVTAKLPTAGGDDMDLQGASLELQDRSGIEDNGLCRINADGSGVTPYNEWWSRNFEHGSKWLVMHTVHLEVIPPLNMA